MNTSMTLVSSTARIFCSVTDDHQRVVNGSTIGYGLGTDVFDVLPEEAFLLLMRQISPPFTDLIR